MLRGLIGEAVGLLERLRLGALEAWEALEALGGPGGSRLEA